MKHWYVVHTQPNGEARATFNLERQGFHVYLPRCLTKRRHARRAEWVQRPLFLRYLFVHIDPECDRWRSINGTFGVNYLIAQEDAPLSVPNSVIEALKSRENDSGLVVPEPTSLRPGQRVEILNGPMAMHIGLFHRMSDNERVVLLLNLLGREVSVTIPYAAVSAA